MAVDTKALRNVESPENQYFFALPNLVCEKSRKRLCRDSLPKNKSKENYQKHKPLPHQAIGSLSRTSVW
jgi:hypothetical protein